MRLTLATYNIHRCVGWDGHYDPDRIRDVVQELDADLMPCRKWIPPISTDSSWRIGWEKSRN